MIFMTSVDKHKLTYLNTGGAYENESAVRISDLNYGYSNMLSKQAHVPE
jgi:hypothetical protein